MSAYLLGVDGGGSKTRAVLADQDGVILAGAEGGPSNYHALGLPVALKNLEETIQAVLPSGQAPQAFVMGLAGFYSEAYTAFNQWAAERYPQTAVQVVNDGALVLAASSGTGPGLAVISGTGSIVLGQDGAGNLVRVGGWGYLMGDEGSAYWIGRQALQAVMAAFDGRGPRTLLSESLLVYFDTPSPDLLVNAVYRPAVGRPEIARLATLVDQAAQHGDAVSLAILERAGLELAQAAQAAAGSLKPAGALACGLAGGALVHSVLLRDQFARQAAALGLRLEPVQVVEEPALGAIVLAKVLLG
jgi:N-acetylglucosamine kinase-like BadF-type ATPase